MSSIMIKILTPILYSRREFEVVRDAVEESLNNENLLIEKIRSQLKVETSYLSLESTKNRAFNISCDF